MEDNKTELGKVDNKEEEIQNNEANSNLIPDEILETLPVEDRNRLSMFFSSVMKRSNPISEKITSEHISKLIENSNFQDERDRKERKSDKNYQIIFLLIGLIFIGFLIVFLKDDKELLYKIIIAIISFIGGFGIGKTKIKQKNID